MAIYSRTTRHGTYYTSPLGSSDPLNMDQMKANARYIYNYCSEMGITINAICGMLGNFQVESTINPGRWQNDDEYNYDLGYGLAQWTPATKYLNAIHPYGNGDPFEMDNNLFYLIEYEIQKQTEYYPTSNYPETYAQFLQSSKSPTYLAKAFLYNYERAGVEVVNKRVEYANYWYEFLTGNTPPIDPDDPTPTPRKPKKRKGFKFVLFLNSKRRIYG